MKEKILVIEDDPAVALGLHHGLTDEGYAVKVVSTGAEALERVWRAPPDLIVLDIRLPDTNGFDLCRTLRADGASQPILMLTVRAEEADKVLGLEVGADDYITKPYSMRELTARVRAHLRRVSGQLAVPSAPDVLTLGDLSIDRARAQVRKDSQLVWLTPIEFRLLLHLASSPGRAFTREQLLDAVWGYASVTDADIVNTHICHLRQKLEDDPANPRYILTVRGIGYAFERQS